MALTASVGRAAVNRRADAIQVQRLLNKSIRFLIPLAPLREDGAVGPSTIGAIELFQSRVVKALRPDGRIDPNGRTYRNLVAAAAALGPFPPSPLPDPPATPGGLSYAQLHEIMPRLPNDKAVSYLSALNVTLVEAQITTPLRKAAFLAQLAHESVELRYFEEIASGEAYEGRNDLGNTEPGDGKRYKGRGPIQLTGRTNYRRAGQALGLDLEGQPETVATREVGFRVAGWFWTTHHLNAKADAGNFDAITRAINGGLNGKESRDAYYATAKRVLGVPES
ncbi:MAG TPA: glycoside hydrolase family 19 protein [Polyangiaceae bacterium]|nr:glycoside hydrolase family 19 protein [Polyangiaceae bacterium]